MNGRGVGSALFFCLFGLLAFGQTVVLDSSNLPIVIIQTMNGVSIPNEPKVEATMRIIDNGAGQINHIGDPANAYDDHIGIEIRGSTSQLFYDKKPYSIELHDEAGADNPKSLLGMPKDEDWALIQPLNDKSLMRDRLAYSLAADIMPWAPRTRYVEVQINGKYQGVYMLVERIKRDKNRVNIQKMLPEDTSGVALTGGYILAFDKVNNGPGGGFGGDWTLPYPPINGSWQSTAVQIKYPKSDDIVPEQREYIKNHLNAFDKSMYDWIPNQPGTPPYEQWIDVDSWVDFMLINEISKNVDGYRLSSWFYKDRDSIDSRIKQGPVWDFNIAFGIGNYCGGNDWAGWAKDFNSICGDDLWVIHFWWPKLCRDYDFQQRVKNRWAALRSTVWTNEALKDRIMSDAAALQEAQVRNFKRWPVLNTYVWPDAFIGGSFSEEVNYLKQWVIQRAEWMDGNIDMVGPSPVRDIIGQDGPVAVFPNPVRNGLLMLEYDFPPNAQLSLRLIDAFGRVVLENYPFPVGKPMHYNVDLSPILAKGMYVLQLFEGGELVQAEKLMVI